jgi:hypothetical protein
VKAISKFSESDWEAIVAPTHTGMSGEAFQQIVKQWLAGAEDLKVSSGFS